MHAEEIESDDSPRPVAAFRGRARADPRGGRATGARLLGAIAMVLCLGASAVVVGCAAAPAAATAPAHPTEEAGPLESFTLLREAADHEALFTLAGGLKPMSTGIWQGSFEVDDPDLAELRRVRAALAPLRNDLWYADVQVFADIHEGERATHAFVVHRRSLARMIERFEAFWSPWGVTPSSHPAEIMAIVDRMPRDDRWRGYGYLFGFPADAVDFFVEAGLAAREGKAAGPERERRFVQIPTFAEETGRFVYAVPADHARTEADEALAREAARILRAYARVREGAGDTDTLLAELRRLDRRFAGARDPQAAR